MDRSVCLRIAAWVVALLSPVLLAPHAGAGTLFLDAGSHSVRFGDGFSFGTRFTVAAPSLEVTALGIHFANGNGPLQSHDIGLWDVTTGNNEVAEATMEAGGAGASVLGGFVYVSLLTPVALNEGDEYVLAAFYPVGEVAGVDDQINTCCQTGTNPTTDPNFSSFSSMYSKTGLASSLGFLSEPTQVNPGTDYAGVDTGIRADSGAGEPGWVWDWGTRDGVHSAAVRFAAVVKKEEFLTRRTRGGHRGPRSVPDRWCREDWHTGMPPQRHGFAKTCLPKRTISYKHYFAEALLRKGMLSQRSAFAKSCFRKGVPLQGVISQRG